MYPFPELLLEFIFVKRTKMSSLSLIFPKRIKLCDCWICCCCCCCNRASKRQLKSFIFVNYFSLLLGYLQELFCWLSEKAWGTSKFQLKKILLFLETQNTCSKFLCSIQSDSGVAASNKVKLTHTCARARIYCLFFPKYSNHITSHYYFYFYSSSITLKVKYIREVV